MKPFNKIVLLALAAICFSQIVTAQQYVIKANIAGFENGTKFYLFDPDANLYIDSAVSKNNRFVLKGELFDTPKPLWLTVGKSLRLYTTLLIGNEIINIKGDRKGIKYDLEITGSKAQTGHDLLIGQIKGYAKKRDELTEQAHALTGDSVKIKYAIIRKAISKLDSARDITVKNFIRTHLNTYEALNQLFYLRNYFRHDLQQMYNSLNPDLKQSSFGQRIATYLKVGDILKKGDSFTDFEATDQHGKKHRLSDFRGKYILLDFSTKECIPCIESIPDMRKISQKYPDKVEVITFSCDVGKATWLSGVSRDKPTWLSLWDGKGIYGSIPLKYGVSGYPWFYIIGPDGKIINNWNGYGKNKDGRGSLETTVEEILAKN